MRALDRKLLRDLLGMKGQAVAIALVVAASIAVLVSSMSTFRSLERTQRVYYERYRFAEVFARMKRAPEPVAERVRAIPGVAQVETRAVADVSIEVAGLEEPAIGRLVSLPPPGRASLNAVYLRRGRMPEPGRPGEALVSEGFAEANKIGPGDHVAAVIHGPGSGSRSRGWRCRPSTSISSGRASCSPTTGASACSGWRARRWRRRSISRGRSTISRSRSGRADRSARSSPSSTGCSRPMPAWARRGARTRSRTATSATRSSSCAGRRCSSRRSSSGWRPSSCRWCCRASSPRSDRRSRC